MTKVAFVSFRLNAQDRVSVEAEKWIGVFREWGFDVFRIAGYIRDPGEHDFIVPELNSQDPQVESFREKVFGPASGQQDLHQELTRMTEAVQRELLPVLREISPDVIVAPNIFSLPDNLPVTVVLKQYLEQENVPCIAHHQDFYWEDDAYSGGVLDELISSGFPPALRNIRNVVVNQRARTELEARSGINAVCIPNCYDFSAPRVRDDFNAGLRGDLGVGEDDIIILQPTRASLNRGIDGAIGFINEFSQESGRIAQLLVTGSCDDGFKDDFQKLCSGSDAGVVHVPGWFGDRRESQEAVSRYDMGDAYAQADMVMYPVPDETAGSPVMESVLHRRLILVADYPLLEELRELGFQFLSFDASAVARTIKLMEYPVLMSEMADRNFEIGKRHFALESLRSNLAELVSAAVFR